MSAKSSIISDPGKQLPRWRQVRWQLVLFIVAAIILSVTFGVSAVAARTRRQAQEQVTAQLESVAALKTDQIERWLADTDAALDLILADPDFHRQLVELIAEADPSFLQRDKVRSTLAGFVTAGGSMQRVFVYDLQGRIIVSSSTTDIPGTSIVWAPYFSPSVEAIESYVHPAYFDPNSGELTIALTHPLYDSGGHLVGVMAGHPNMQTLYAVMQARTGLGEGGETYLVSRATHHLLTPSRDSSVSRNQVVESIGIDQALEGHEGTGLYSNYQDSPTEVLGAYHYIPELDAALLAELPTEEAFRTYNNAQRVSLGFAGFAAVLMATAGYFIISRATRPISSLTYAATRIARGDLGERVAVTSQNEFGVLAGAFNSMADQLETMVTNLEERVEARTRDLHVASEVARQISSALNLGELLPRVVELTKEKFDLYHAHIYLIDEARRLLKMEAGAGEPGRIMKEMGHSIPVNAERSLVARAARTGKPIIINDVQAEAGFLPNPLLPDTRSEMAVPLLLGETAIGVLDVQSQEAGRFTAQDAEVVGALAGQVAVAVQNARLFDQTGRSERLLRAVLDASPDWIWAKDAEHNFILANRALADQSLGVKPEEAVGKSDYDFTDRTYVDGDPERGIRGLRASDEAALRGEQVFSARDVVKLRDGRERILSTRKSPIYDAEGKIIGTVGVGHDITELEQTRQRQQTAYELGERLNRLLNVEELLKETISRLDETFRYYHAHVYLYEAETGQLRVAEGLGEAGAMLKSVGHAIPLEAERSLVARAARSLEPVVALNVMENPDHLPNPLLAETRSEAAIPLYTGDRLLGVLDVQSDRAGHFDDDEIRTLRIIGGQVSVSLANARLFENVRSSERLVRSIIDTTPDWIFAKDANYRYLVVNRAFAQYYGNRTPEEMVGKDDYDLGTPAYLIEGDPERGIRGFRADDRAVIEQGQSVANPHDIVLFPDGAEHILDTKKTPLTDSTGRVIGVLGVSRDITDQESVRLRQQTAYELGERLNSVLDVEQLLQETTTRLGESFRYYHAHIYLFDAQQQALRVAEGLGEAGAMLKAMGHSIPLDSERSLVARAARTLEPIIENDVQAAPDHLPNPLLPDTRSEVAIPLYTGDRLLGVLDVQSNVLAHFDQDEVRTLRIIAGQLSVSLSNARLFEEAQSALAEAATLYASSEQISRATAFEDLLNALVGTTPLGRFDRANITLFDKPWADERPDTMTVRAVWEASGEAPRGPVGTTYPLDQMPVMALLSRDAPSVFLDMATDPRVDDYTRTLFLERLKMKAIAVFPLVVAGQWIGIVTGQSAEAMTVEEGELRHIATVADQAATVVQNLLLLREAQTRLAETTALQARLQAIIDAANSAIISFGSDEGLLLFNHVAEEIFGYTADEASSLGVDAFIADFSKLLTRAADNKTQVRESFEVTGRRKNGEEFPAEVSLSWLTLEGRPVITIVLNDITERRRVESRERLAYELGQDLTILFSPDLLLKETIQHLHEGLGYYHAHVYLYDPQNEELYVREGLGEAGRILKEMGHSIPYQAERSLVARAARTLEPVVVNNVYDSPDHLPNPLLPETVSEVALPLYSGDHLIGVLDVQHNVPGYFSDAEVRTLRIVSNQLTIALSNAQLYLEQLEARANIERSARELALLNRVIDAASSTLNQADMLKLICYEVATAFKVEQVAASLVNEARTEMTVVGEYLSAGRPSMLGVSIPTEGNPLAELFLSSQRPVAVSEVHSDPRLDTVRPMLEQRGVQSLLLIPFVVEDQIIGGLGLDFLEPHEFTHEELALAHNVGTATSQGLHNALLYEETVQNAERLREVDRLKSEFLANMSHELRTPLNSIIGYSELLIDEMGGQIDEMSFEDLKAIHSSGQHLLAIINDVLDLAKIEAGRLELNRTPADIGELAGQIQEAAKVLTKDKPHVALELEIEEDLPEIEADKVRVRQVIWNLLSNAIKFTEEGCVTLAAQVKGDMLHISVRDTGIGIPPEYHDVIFDQFRQADGSATRKAGGTGLGLAITRQLVWLHGGDIWVESQPGKGSTFTFSLPLKAPSDSKPARPEDKIPEAAPGAD